jgi:hypothetical protein
VSLTHARSPHDKLRALSTVHRTIAAGRAPVAISICYLFGSMVHVMFTDVQSNRLNTICTVPRVWIELHVGRLYRDRMGLRLSEPVMQ